MLEGIKKYIHHKRQKRQLDRTAYGFLLAMKSSSDEDFKRLAKEARASGRLGLWTMFKTAPLKTVAYSLVPITIIAIAIFSVSVQVRDYKQHKAEVAQEAQDRTNFQKMFTEMQDRLNATCNKNLSELTGVELNSCEHNVGLIPPPGTTAANPTVEDYLNTNKLPAFCERKVLELTANELMDCLYTPR